MSSTTPTLPFSYTATEKLREARFFLARAQEALVSPSLNEADKQEHARYFGSACLAAARAPINYFMDSTNKHISARQAWYNANLATYPAISELRKIRNQNIHDQPTPIVNIRVMMDEVPGAGVVHVLTLVDGNDNTDIMSRLVDGIDQTETMINRILAECSHLL